MTLPRTYPTLARSIAIATALLAAGSATARAGWNGSEVTKDGVKHVMNPAEPATARTTLSPETLWHAGGMEDDDVIFGVVTHITADGSGNLYLLDTQLNEVTVFSPDGEYLRSIGREGEGPGEFRRPSGLFLTPDGNVAVLQSMPGRVILMTRDGEPIGNHPVPQAPDGGMMMFFQGDRAGDHLVLDTRSVARRDDGMDITRELVRVNAQGEAVGTLYKKTDQRNFASMSFDEKDMMAISWTCGPDGRVYVSDDFDAYRILVYSPAGAVERVIERAYEHRQRTPEEMEERKPRIMMRRRGRGAQSPETKASETDRDILAMFPRNDGSLWVVSSSGGLDGGDGAIATFDVFDADGHFEQQVAIKGDGNYDEDGLHFVGNRLVVVKGLRSAERAQQGGENDEASEQEMDDAEPVSLVCYDLGGTRRAAGN